MSVDPARRPKDIVDTRQETRTGCCTSRQSLEAGYRLESRSKFSDVGDETRAEDDDPMHLESADSIVPLKYATKTACTAFASDSTAPSHSFPFQPSQKRSERATSFEMYREDRLPISRSAFAYGRDPIY